MELTNESCTLELPDALAEVKRRRMLILEDDPPLRRILWKTFTDWGWSASAAATLEEAKQFSEKTSYELIVSDYNLPDGTGLDLMQWIIERKSVPPPFILMSADAWVPSHLHAKPLQKPFSVDQLRAMIELFPGFSNNKAGWN